MSEPAKRVLVVDHDPEVRARLLEQLQAWGYETEAPQTAEEALRLIPHHRPDLVILDVEMPDQDGYLVCAKLKRFSQRSVERIPVILCSVRASERDRHLGRYAGCDDYVLKPFDWCQLAEHVEKLLARLPQPPE
jgi:two-component system KDP operon response regulator KdpE